MEMWDYMRKSVVNYKLESCCCLVPVRVGVLFVGYLDLLVSVILVVGTASDSFAPTIKRVQELIFEEASNGVCVMAPATELAFSVLLLCAMHRDDVVLLRVYVWYGLAAVATSLLVYSIVIAGISILYILAIAFSLLYQLYVLILVRSAIVDIRTSRPQHSNGHVKPETNGAAAAAPGDTSEDSSSAQDPESPEELRLDTVHEERVHVVDETAPGAEDANKTH